MLWQKFGPDILAAAETNSIEHFFAFGEVFDQQFGPSFLSEFSTRGQLQSTIDFAFQMAARDFASQDGDTDNLRVFFEKDDYYTDADSNAATVDVDVTVNANGSYSIAAIDAAAPLIQDAVVTGHDLVLRHADG